MLIKRINNGDLLPSFYGIAWVDLYRNQAVCLPLGLNALVAVCRSAYHSVRHAGLIVRANPRDAYEQGFRAGRASAHGVGPTEPW